MAAAPIPRYRAEAGPALLSAGFRPFFLFAAAWAAVAVPLWLLFLSGRSALPTAMPPLDWHAHEMIFGFGGATVGGFFLTAIPNWTGRMPIQGASLATLALLWSAGRLAVLFSAWIGAGVAAAFDLAFPVIFLIVIAREILAGRNWRNLPMVAALGLLLLANFLVHLEILGGPQSRFPGAASLGNRLGFATLLLLISLIGGRIIPSFTRNWLAKHRQGTPPPPSFGRLDKIALAIVALALLLWVVRPEGEATPWAELAAGLALGARLSRWRGLSAMGEPLLGVLHLGYSWLAFGLVLLALNARLAFMPQSTALHALSVGAVGTMTLAVMTRASLGHTGQALTAGAGTSAIYLLITLAAFLRLLAPFAEGAYPLMLSLAGAAWSGAFGLFILLYFRSLTAPRAG